MDLEWVGKVVRFFFGGIFLVWDEILLGFLFFFFFARHVEVEFVHLAIKDGLFPFGNGMILFRAKGLGRRIMTGCTTEWDSGGNILAARLHEQADCRHVG